MDSFATPPSDPSHCPPHEVLATHYENPEEREEVLRRLFDESALHYDWINRLMSLGTGERYRARVLERVGLTAGMRVVDVACGTGVVSALAARLVGDPSLVTSIDPSPGMREQAKRKRAIEAVEGKAEQLPVEDQSADLVVMGYALRHVDDLVAAFKEFRRVLKPGGRVLAMEITAPRGRMARFLLRSYLHALIPTVAWLGTGSKPARKLMEYHWDSIENCVPPEDIVHALGEAGLQGPERSVTMGIFSEYTATCPRK